MIHLLETIKAAGWSNESTFYNLYNKKIVNNASLMKLYSTLNTGFGLLYVNNSFVSFEISFKHK